MTDIQGINSLHLHSERAKRDVWLEDLAPLEAGDEQSRMEGIAFVNVHRQQGCQCFYGSGRDTECSWSHRLANICCLMEQPRFGPSLSAQVSVFPSFGVLPR